MSVEPETIFSAVLIFMWVEFLWEALLSSRQRTIYKVGAPQISSADHKQVSCGHKRFVMAVAFRKCGGLRIFRFNIFCDLRIQFLQNKT